MRPRPNRAQAIITTKQRLRVTVASHAQDLWRRNGPRLRWPALAFPAGNLAVHRSPLRSGTRPVLSRPPLRLPPAARVRVQSMALAGRTAGISSMNTAAAQRSPRAKARVSENRWRLQPRQPYPTGARYSALPPVGTGLLQQGLALWVNTHAARKEVKNDHLSRLAHAAKRTLARRAWVTHAQCATS